MKAILIVAGGLIISSMLMLMFAVDYLTWFVNDSSWMLFTSGLHSWSPTMGLTSMPIVGNVSFVLLCVGAGLSISCLIYYILYVALMTISVIVIAILMAVESFAIFVISFIDHKGWLAISSVDVSLFFKSARLKVRSLFNQWVYCKMYRLRDKALE